MKAKIIRTGEIIDVVWDDKMDSWSNCNDRSIFYLNNELSFLKDKEIDWEERRYQIAKEAVRGVALNTDCFTSAEIKTTVKNALKLADILIAELKKGGPIPS